MAKSCPDCGAAVEYQTRSIQLLEGTCASCGHAAVLAAPLAVDGADGERAAVGSAAPVAPCWECGAALTFQVHPDRSVDAVCSGCGVATHLTQGGVRDSPGEGEADEEDDEEEASEDEVRTPRRPMRASAGRFPPRPAGRWEDRPRGPRRDDERSDRPPARPCRQCGGPLEFSQNDDGTVTGTCRSCGNTFTMRPREDRPDRGFARRPGWGGRPRNGPSSNYSPRRYPRPRGDDSERPRRRRRDD